MHSTIRGHLASGARMMTAAQGALDLKPDFHLTFVSNHHQILLKAVQTRKPLHSWPGKDFRLSNQSIVPGKI